MNIIIVFLFSVLFTGCIWASLTIPLWVEWHTLKESAWFLVTLLDLYIGLIMFSCLVFAFKKKVLYTLLWTLLFFCLGNMATLLWIYLNRNELYDRIY